MKRSVWDFLAWLVLFAILLFLILKSSGAINPSGWENYSVYIGLVYLAGWAMHKLDILYSELRELRKFKFETINEIKKMKLNYFSKDYYRN